MSVSAPAQESFPATHLVRLDIVEPDPNAGTIGGVAIIATDNGKVWQIRVTAANGNGEGGGQLIPARTRLTGPTGAVPPATSYTIGCAASYNRHNRNITFAADAAPATRRIDLYGADGRLVRSAACEGSSCGISADGLPAGPCFASLRDAGGSAIGACSVMVVP